MCSDFYIKWKSWYAKPYCDMQECTCNIWTGPYPMIGSIMGECGLDSLHPQL